MKQGIQKVKKGGWKLLLALSLFVFLAASQAMAGGDDNDPRGTGPGKPGSKGSTVDGPAPGPVEVQKFAPLGHGTDEIGPKMILKVLVRDSNQ